MALTKSNLLHSCEEQNFWQRLERTGALRFHHESSMAFQALH